MHSNVEIPGFTAAIVLERSQRDIDFNAIYRESFDDHIVAQGNRGCGFAIGLAIIGAFGNPAFLVGGVAGIASWC